MDVRLKQVVAVARYGSFTAAAEAIGVTQSAVTRGVADLERQLGYELFHRISRGASLTEQGRIFSERAARLLDDEQELLNGDPNDNDPFKGVLRIGVSPASLEWTLAQPIAMLKRHHPDIRFEVIGSSFERMAPMLRNGGVDLAVGIGEAFGEWPDLTQLPLFDLKSVLFARKGHPLFDQPRIVPADIAGCELVSPSDSRPYGAVIRSLYESEGADWRKRLHVVDSFPIARRIVDASDALGVVSTSHVTSPSFTGRFAVVEGVDLFDSAPICCATRGRWQPNAAAKAFIKAMQDYGPQKSETSAAR